MTPQWPTTCFSCDVTLVHALDLTPAPIGDQVLAELCDPDWYACPVLHRLSLRVEPPGSRLAGIHRVVVPKLAKLRTVLGSLRARVLPTGMHPLLDPVSGVRTWKFPEGDPRNAMRWLVNRSSHAWSNVAGVRFAVGWSDEEQLRDLLRVCRLLVPIAPALAASSPLAVGEYSGYQSTRVESMRQPGGSLASLVGSFVPEPAYTESAYRKEVLQPVQREIEAVVEGLEIDIEEFDRRGAVLQPSRRRVLVRALDAQECLSANLAVSLAFASVLRGVMATGVASHHREIRQSSLVRTLRACARLADDAVLDDEEYLEVLGMHPGPITAAEVWLNLIDRYPPNVDHDPSVRAALRVYLEQGSLASRIRASLGESPSPSGIRRVYRELCEGFDDDRSFEA